MDENSDKTTQELKISPKLREWKIKSKAVENADKRRKDLNYDFSICEKGLGESPIYFNRYAVKITLSKALDLRKTVRRLSRKPLDNFDMIMLEDIDENAKRIILLFEWSYGNRKPKIVQVLRTITGDRRPFGTLERMFEKAIDNPMHYNYDRAFYRQSIKSRDADLDETRAVLKEKVKKYKSIARDFALQFGLIESGDLPQKILLAPHGYDFSYYDDANMIVAMKPDIIREDRVSLIAAVTAIHEFAGHGLNSAYSALMPSGLNPDEAEYYFPTYGLHSEGIALAIDELGQRWLSWKKNKRVHGAPIKEVELLKTFQDVYVDRKAMQTLHDIYYLLYNENEYHAEKNPYSNGNTIKEAAMKIGNLAKARRLAIDYWTFESRTMPEALGDLSYIFGRRIVKKELSNLGKLVDLRKSENRTAIYQAMLHGQWVSPTAKEKFMKEMLLPHMKDVGIIK